MRFLKTVRNTLFTIILVSRYIIEGLWNAFVNRHNDIERRRRALEITAKNCKALLAKLGVDIKVSDSVADVSSKNYFLVCNHMSYVDILVLSCWNPSMFVTSVEMEKTFFLGDMAKLGGSFFVNRINRRKMKEEVETLKNLSSKGLNVFIFPEGTSTNGVDGILPFKKSLFRVPFQADIPILPICLKYKTIDGEKFSRANCSRVAWYDDMTFGPHILQLMTIRSMDVSIELMEPMEPSTFENHGDLALEAQKKIQKAYGAPESW